MITPWAATHLAYRVEMPRTPRYATNVLSLELSVSDQIRRNCRCLDGRGVGDGFY